MCQQVTGCVFSLWAHGPTGKTMPTVTAALPSFSAVPFPRTVEGQLVDTARGCHFVILCFPQLKPSVSHKVCFPAIKINTTVTRGCRVHAELCYNSGFRLVSRFVLPGFVFIKVHLLRQLVTFFSQHF